MDNVVLRGLRVDDGVVQKGGAEAVEVFRQGLIDIGLEGSGGIGLSEGHDQALKESVLWSEGGLPLITLSHPDKVVGAPNVELGEVLGLAVLRHGLLDQG